MNKSAFPPPSPADAARPNANENPWLSKLRMQSLPWPRLLLALGTVAVSVAVLGLLLYRERDVLLAYDWQIRPGFLPAGLGLMLGGTVLAAWIWGSLMNALGSAVDWGGHVYIYCISQLAKRIPGTLWYVAGRGYLYRERGESVRLVTVATGIELVITVLAGALVSLACASYALVDLPRAQWWGLLAAVGAGVACTHPRAIGWLLRRTGLEAPPRLRYARVLAWLGGYVLLYVVGGLIFFTVANVVTPVAARHVPFIIGSWSLVSTLSVLVFFLPSNLGFTEVGLSLLLSSLIPSSLAVLVAVLSRLLFIVYELGSVGIILLAVRIRGRANP